MKQSPWMSFVESTINILVGFGISCAAQAIFLPMLGVPIPWDANLAFAVIMTVISLMRSFVLRRVFEALHIRRPLSPFMQAVIAERFRQIEVEGWTHEYDDGHSPRVLAQAGAAYLIGAERFTATDYEDEGEPSVPISGRILWPWAIDDWKPRELRRNYVRGCALGLAAGELADRQRKSSRKPMRGSASEPVVTEGERLRHGR